MSEKDVKISDEYFSGFAHLEDNVKEPFENKKVFIPTETNRPPALKPIITINGVSILTHQNVTAIIAKPGSGKSSVCEAICSSAINDDCDSLGIQVSTEVKKVLFVDTERVNVDVWNSYRRMNKRANTTNSNKAQIVGLRMVPRIEERKQVIIDLIEYHKPQLLILDGAGDMVTSTNCPLEAVEMRIWFRELTAKYNLSILTTLHPNKGSENPRGHIGGELLRESEGIFIIRTNGNVKTLTDNFEHGKNRNGEKTSTSFTWSDTRNMFVSCEEPENPAKKLEANLILSHEDIANLILEIAKTELGATDFKNKLKGTLKQRHPNVRVGATNINDFYTWLEINEFISVIGTHAKKLVTAYPNLLNRFSVINEPEQSKLNLK